jgi:hypothetical protein
MSLMTRDIPDPIHATTNPFESCAPGHPALLSHRRRILHMHGQARLPELSAWAISDSEAGMPGTRLLVQRPRVKCGSTVVGGGLRSVGGACARLMMRRVGCARAPGLTSVHDPRVGPGAGDMMFDGVVPLGEALRPLGLSGPST